MSHYPGPNEKTWQRFQMFLWVEAVFYEKKRRSPLTEAKVSRGKAKSALEHAGSARLVFSALVQVVLCRVSWLYLLCFCSAGRRNINNSPLLVWVTVCWSLSESRRLKLVEHASSSSREASDKIRRRAHIVVLVSYLPLFVFDHWNNLELITCLKLRVGVRWEAGQDQDLFQHVPRLSGVERAAEKDKWERRGQKLVQAFPCRTLINFVLCFRMDCGHSCF